MLLIPSQATKKGCDAKLKYTKSVAVGFVIATVLIASVSALTWYWASQTMTHHIVVVGIEGGLYQTTYTGYDTHIDASDLDGNGEVFLCVTAENFYDLALQIQVNNAPENLLVTASGDWASVWFDTRMEVNKGTISRVGGTIDLDGAINVDGASPSNIVTFTDTPITDVMSKQRLMYRSLSWNSFDRGAAITDINVLIVQLQFDTEFVTPSEYDVQIVFNFGNPT